MSDDEAATCVDCGKVLDEAEMMLLAKLLATELTKNVDPENPEQANIALTMASLMAIEHCGACFERNNAKDPLSRIINEILEDPSKNPILFQWTEVTRPA